MALGNTIKITDIPPRLKGKIARRVSDTGSNMTDVLVGILAAHYKLPFAPTGVSRGKIGKSTQANLPLPADLKKVIATEAFETDETQRNVAMRIICAEFDEPFAPTGRWPKPEPVAA